jgi:hypothetical protein
LEKIVCSWSNGFNDAITGKWADHGTATTNGAGILDAGSRVCADGPPEVGNSARIADTG